jgi:hypothetical protein
MKLGSRKEFDEDFISSSITLGYVISMTFLIENIIVNVVVSEGVDHTGQFRHHPSGCNRVKCGGPTFVSQYNPHQFHSWSRKESLV